MNPCQQIVGLLSTLVLYISPSSSESLWVQPELSSELSCILTIVGALGKATTIMQILIQTSEVDDHLCMSRASEDTCRILLPSCPDSDPSFFTPLVVREGELAAGNMVPTSFILLYLTA